MKNKGFIATSLIYSFFLVFCAVLLSYIGVNVHNKNLLKRANDDIRTDLQGKKLKDAPIGAYVNLNMSHPNYKIEGIDWIVFNSDEKETLLVSDAVIMSINDTNGNLKDDIENINLNIKLFNSPCLNGNIRILTYNDLYTTMKNNASTTNIASTLTNIDSTYLLVNNNNYYKYTFNSSNPFNTSNSTTYQVNERINVRLVVSLPSNIMISGGSGNISNPYTVSENNCFEDSSLLGKVLSSGYDNKTNYTVPGRAVATSNEGLRTTEDDYGTSYYFRGNIDNNYVVFANMCWRIVRITGRGDIKLTLYNYNSSNCTESGGSLAFARYSGSTYTTAFNTTSNSNTYIGYMYGQASANSYEEEHGNANDSTILQNLKTWYDSKFTSTEKNMLADTIWCNDKRVSSGTGYQTSKTYYMSNARLFNTNTATPSLKCGEGMNHNKISKLTSGDNNYGMGKLNGYKIGLLTADEVAYAGATYSQKSTGYYLMKNAVDINWWTLSPSCYGCGDVANAMILNIETTGNISASNTANSNNGIRPAIALNSNVIAKGSGYNYDPYIIIER